MTPEERRKFMNSLLDEMRDSLARRIAILDQLEAAIKHNRDAFGEERFKEHQADLAVKRAQIEADKRILAQKEAQSDNF